jgi:predicted ester cyclase
LKLISLLISTVAMIQLRSLPWAVVLLSSSLGCAPPVRPASPQPRDVVAQAVHALFNEGQLDAADRYFAPGFALEERRFAEVVRRAFPDLVIRLDRVVQEGGWVAIRWTATGTHRGAFGDLAATGRRATWSGAWFWRVADGKIIEGKALNVWDQKSLRDQLTGARP